MRLIIKKKLRSWLPGLHSLSKSLKNEHVREVTIITSYQPETDLVQYTQKSRKSRTKKNWELEIKLISVDPIGRQVSVKQNG